MCKFFQKLYYRVFIWRKKRSLRKLVDRGLKLGKDVGIVGDCFLDPAHCYLISIGDNCTLAPNVRLIAHDASTKKFLGYTKLGKIIIKENCFIGDSVTVLLGVTIGPNSIIGAGSVVTRNIPPDSVAAGNPARVLCSLDEYLHKIEALSKTKKTFERNYWIKNLDVSKREELLKSLDDDIGFIV